MLVARVEDQPRLFGFELKPASSAWFGCCRVRRQGIASQLMDAITWLIGYDSIRFECHNQHRPMLHMAIALGYDIVGIRWDPDRGDNLVIFEKALD